MADPVNLGKVRKARARAEKRAQADANAVKFGRTKAERLRDALNDARARKAHEAHKRDKP